MLWTANSLGRGYGSTAVVGDRVFLQGGNATSSVVIALNRADGRPVWAKVIGPAETRQRIDQGAGPRGTPTVDGDRLYVRNQDTLHVYDIKATVTMNTATTSISGKVVVITGASSGLGEALALERRVRHTARLMRKPDRRERNTNVKPKLPVMVWIYGGAFLFGSGSNPTTSGVQFAKDGVILVTFNYRVGRLGFFAFPGLTREHAEELKGNYAYTDQLEALKWVQRNIAAFGGDPKNVTIFGESAGGASVSRSCHRPFRRACSKRPSSNPAAAAMAH